MDNKKNKGGVALLFGAIVGGIAGLLFAPKSGKETREDVKKVIKESEEKLKKTGEKAKEVAAHAKDKVEEVVEKVVEKVKHSGCCSGDKTDDKKEGCCKDEAPE